MIRHLLDNYSKVGVERQGPASPSCALLAAPSSHVRPWPRKQAQELRHGERGPVVCKRARQAGAPSRTACPESAQPLCPLRSRCRQSWRSRARTCPVSRAQRRKPRLLRMHCAEQLLFFGQELRAGPGRADWADKQASEHVRAQQLYMQVCLLRSVLCPPADDPSQDSILARVKFMFGEA